jgi:hypothetical protein
MTDFPDYANDSDYEWSDDRGTYMRVKGRSGARQLMRDELKKIKKIVYDGGQVEPLTQNGFYYHMRTIFLDNGIDPEHEGKLFRHSLLGDIPNICHELGTTREDLNIIAKERATFYYNGEQFKVSLRLLEDLAKKGTDIIIIEKSGICDLLAPFAAKAGIALLDTAGFVVEYARKLSQLSQENGCNIAILTDFDDAGLLMARKVIDEIPEVYRIGIDSETREDLLHLLPENLKPKLVPRNIEERYTAGDSIKRLEGMGPAAGEKPETFRTNLEYVRSKRIEIDSIERAVGNLWFWEFVKMKLQKQFPQRDYNRSIIVPDIVYPSVYWEIVEELKQKIGKLLADDVDEIEQDLASYNGIIDDIDDKSGEIIGQLRYIITNDQSFQPVLKVLNRLLTELKILKTS